MNYHFIDIEGKEIKFRLTSKEMTELEKRTNRKLLEILQDDSINSIITVLKHMRRFEVPNFSHDDACELFDELADAGYSLERIEKEIIMPACVASGLLTKSDLTKALKKSEEQATQTLA